MDQYPAGTTSMLAQKQSSVAAWKGWESGRLQVGLPRPTRAE